MTHDRTQDITAQFDAWLDGYSPPASMRDNPERMQAEKLSLLRIVLKYAPDQNWRGFVSEALDQCAMIMKTRAWPTMNELGDAFRNHQKEAHGAYSHSHAPSGWNPDPAQINADRMRRGDAVGEPWLYGILACEMIARRLIDHDTMKRYRSAAFFARKNIYGEEAAIEWEEDAKAAHEAAKAMWRARNDARGMYNTGAISDVAKFPGADSVAF